MDEENNARLSGLLAMIALPLVNAGNGMMRRVPVEVEVSPGKWRAIEGAEVTLGKLSVWTGSNGSRTVFTFNAAQCPRWRSESNSERRSTMIHDDDDAGNYNFRVPRSGT